MANKCCDEALARSGFTGQVDMQTLPSLSHNTTCHSQTTLRNLVAYQALRSCWEEALGNRWLHVHLTACASRQMSCRKFWASSTFVLVNRIPETPKLQPCMDGCESKTGR